MNDRRRVVWIHLPAQIAFKTRARISLLSGSFLPITNIFVGINGDEWCLEMIDQKIYKCSGARRLIALPGIINKEVGRGQYCVWQHQFETATLYILCQIPFRSDQNSVPIESPPKDDIAVITGERTFHFQRFRVVVHDVSPHSIRIIVLPMNDATVLQQIFDTLGCSEAFKIFRGRTEKAPIAHDAPRTETAVRQLAEPYRHIERTLHQIDRPVRHFKLDLDMREALREVRHERRYCRSAKSKGRVHPQKALRIDSSARYRFFHLANLPDDLRRVSQVRLALGRQADASRRPVDQPRAKPSLYDPKPLGRCRRGEIERARRSRHTLQLRKKYEEFEVGCRVSSHF